jgi:hypothetical protein
MLFMLDQILSVPIGPCFSISEIRRAWDELAEYDCILHFLVHASGTELHLSDDERITVSRFYDLFERRVSGRDTASNVPLCLVFLNGCSTGAGEQDNSFITATARMGFSGCIATEVDVPVQLAVRVGLNFLRYLLHESESVQEAMNHLRRDADLWPLGLLYCSYAYADFRVEAA